jgi:hypothetical protein
MLGITEHEISESERVISLINYSPEKITSPITLAEGWALKELYYGSARVVRESLIIDLARNDSAVMLISRK